MEIKDKQREELLDILREAFDYSEIEHIDMEDDIEEMLSLILNDRFTYTNYINALDNAYKYLNKILKENRLC